MLNSNIDRPSPRGSVSGQQIDFICLHKTTYLIYKLEKKSININLVMIFCYLVEPTVISVSRLSQDCIIEPLSGLLYSHFGVNFTNHDLSGTHQYLPNH